MKESKNRYKNLSSIICIIAYVTAEFLTICSPSEAKNAILGSFSVFRIMLLVMNSCCAALVLWMLQQVRHRKGYLFPMQMIACFMIFLPFTILQVALLDTENTIFTIMKNRAWASLVFIFLCGITILTEAAASENKTPRDPNIKYEFFISLALIVYSCIIGYFDKITLEKNFEYIGSFCLLAVISLIFHAAAKTLFHSPKITDIAFYTAVFFIAFFIIRVTQMWVGRIRTPSSAYWAELAESFIHGHLYLESPSAFHDLTMYEGHWYVPNPPLPAVLLIPFVWLFGTAEKINMTVYSAIIGAVNAVFIFIVLKEAVREKLFSLSNWGIFWAAAAFILGSDHLWLATTGQMWFISQLIVVTFTLLAVILQIKHKHPLWVGCCLGAAMFSRPNIFPVFFCIAGIWLWQEEQRAEKFNLKKTFIWCLKCGIPMAAFVMLLLWYNQLRFGNWLDFGYVTINGAEDIVESAQTYGMFNIHFLHNNFRVMFTLLPRIDRSGEKFWFRPYTAGYSVFLMSPYLIYAFRAFKKNTWALLSWFSVICTVILLLFYHNTGAEQIGYRYILDAAAPLVLLVGKGMKGKSSVLFSVLTIHSVLLQLISIYWWYIGRI